MQLQFFDKQGDVSTEISIFRNADKLNTNDYGNVYARLLRASSDGGFFIGGFDLYNGPLIGKINPDGQLEWRSYPGMTSEVIDLIQLPGGNVVWLSNKAHGSYDQTYFSLFNTNESGDLIEEYSYYSNMAWKLFQMEDGNYSLLCHDEIKGLLFRSLIPY
jgi:hypothetical protein